MKPKHALWLFVFLCGALIADGTWTWYWVQRFGPAAEANPLDKALMHLVGVVPAMLITRGIGIGLSVKLYRRESFLLLSFLLGAYTMMVMMHLNALFTFLGQ